MKDASAHHTGCEGYPILANVTTIQTDRLIGYHTGSEQQTQRLVIGAHAAHHKAVPLRI
jgi:hypothetical protein